MYIEEIFGIIIGVIALFISIVAYIQSLPSLKLIQDQKAAMYILSNEALILYDLFQIVLACVIAGNPPDPYLLGVMQSQAKYLRESIRDAIRLRLWNSVIGVKPHALTLHTAFMAALISAEEQQDTEPWIKEHFTMGIVRIITLCDNYHRQINDPLFGPLLSEKVNTFGELRDRCWVYLNPIGSPVASPASSASSVGSVQVNP